jgi:hypothetical protein
MSHTRVVMHVRRALGPVVDSACRVVQVCTHCLFSVACILMCAVFCCAAGSFSPSGVCLPCPVGHAYNGTGATVCSACAAGRAAPDTGSSACLPCTAGTHTPTSGADRCITCGVGTTSMAEATSCFECGVGVVCQGGVVSVQPDYWLLPLRHEGGNMRVSAVLCPPGTCLADGQCAANRLPPSSNVLCGQCLEGYALWNDECVGTCPRECALIGISLVSCVYVCGACRVHVRQPRTAVYTLASNYLVCGGHSQTVARDRQPHAAVAAVHARNRSLFARLTDELARLARAVR